MRCDREIEALKAEARNGNPDVEGIALGLHDWRTEKRMICSPLELVLVGLVDGTLADERRIHLELRRYRDHGEWFNLPEALVLRMAYRLGRRDIPPEMIS